MPSFPLSPRRAHARTQQPTLGEATRLVEAGEKYLEEKSHPDPYIVPYYYGGSSYHRNPPFPKEVSQVHLSLCLSLSCCRKPSDPLRPTDFHSPGFRQRGLLGDDRERLLDLGSVSLGDTGRRNSSRSFNSETTFGHNVWSKRRPRKGSYLSCKRYSSIFSPCKGCIPCKGLVRASPCKGFTL